MKLIVSDEQGVYVPKVFAKTHSIKFSFGGGKSHGYTYHQAIGILHEGPYYEGYWDAWTAILDGARLKSNPHQRLYHDGDLFQGTITEFNKHFSE